ncbi:unnamed protein product [Adineta steineri]|uniref:RING-type E3 ubiquitin transferase n=1 Tax=Adineta steineri TaxID=433720 RepID=A0A814CIH6_9BILA|nr:unnamed protein product [Adineta steineri]CAF0941287.1 unnamed protein product [Adineta steineri]CAF3665106.1 unnamed protein product [Adineta steineri]CAF3688640.1 unnamed protein product [Adineta steineri]
MATARPNYYCHKCQAHIGHVTDLICPRCHEDFIEEVPPQEPTPQSRINQRRTGGGTFQIHGATPFGNTTIVIGGGQSPNDGHNPHGNGDLGNFLQTVLTQLAGGLTGGGAVGGAPFPFVMHNAGGTAFLDANNLDAFLTQFLNQMGENSGPAPATENRINSIPTVRVTGEQARDNLQCAICMDDFKENDEAKRLPCSHHFHEDCISRWLRLHGTCPTCRVTLDGDNTTNREYFNLQPNQQQSTSNNNNNRRNDGDNNGSSSSAASGGGFNPEFD